MGAVSSEILLLIQRDLNKEQDMSGTTNKEQTPRESPGRRVERTIRGGYVRGGCKNGTHTERNGTYY